MDYKKLKNNLGNDHPAVRVDIFINYLKQLEAEKKQNDNKEWVIKNTWFFNKSFTEEVVIDLFNKVAKDNIFIDGDSITLGNNFGKISVTYNFQAYKNLVLNIYPESIIDIQLVYKDDDIFFKKDSGKVIYEHTITDPFAVKKEIIGAYCVIKNKRGEFLETINKDDIVKFKAVAKTKTMWNEWEGEMVKKSIIKRACKTHFKDIVQNVDEIDNENYDLSKVGLNLTDEQTTLLLRLEKILPEQIKDDVREALKGRIEGKQFASFKNTIEDYISKIEKQIK